MQGPRSTPAPAPSPAAPRRPPYQAQGCPPSQIPRRGRRCDRERACTAAASTAPSCESYSSGTASATHTGGRPPSSISSTSAARAVRLRAAAPHARRQRSMVAGRWWPPVVGGSSRPAARQRAFSRAALVRQESVPSHHRRTVCAPVAATPTHALPQPPPHPPLLDTARQRAARAHGPRRSPRARAACRSTARRASSPTRRRAASPQAAAPPSPARRPRARRPGARTALRRGTATRAPPARPPRPAEHAPARRAPSAERRRRMQAARAAWFRRRLPAQSPAVTMRRGYILHMRVDSLDQQCLTNGSVSVLEAPLIDHPADWRKTCERRTASLCTKAARSHARPRFQQALPPKKSRCHTLSAAYHCVLLRAKAGQ